MINDTTRIRPQRSPWLQVRLACALLCGCSFATAQAPANARDVEAAYLVNFLRFANWPAQCFETDQSALVVTVVGSQSVALRVRAVADAAGPINGRSIQVQWLSKLPEGDKDNATEQTLRRSHLVFFDHSSERIDAKQLAAMRALPILTVSDAQGFVAAGGMLELFDEADHIVFGANPSAIRNAGISLSAKVLKLARAPGEMPP